MANQSRQADDRSANELGGASRPSPGAATPGRWRFLRKGTFYATGVLVTAVIGALVAQRFDQADLRVYLTSVSIDSPTLDSQELERSLRERQGLFSYGADFSRNSRLIELSQSLDWLPDVGANSAATFDGYLSGVYSLREEAGRSSESIKTLSRGLAKWPNPISEINLDAVYTIVRANSGIVMGAVFGEVRRHGNIFSTPAVDQKGKKSFYTMAQNDNGDIYVDSGSRRLHFPWNAQCQHDGEGKELCRETAKRLANALAYLNARDLDDLKVVLDRTLKDQAQLSEALQISEEEIERFSYWRATVTLTNNGKEPIAVSPWAMMVVNPPASATKNPNPLSTSAGLADPRPINVPVQIIEKRILRPSSNDQAVDVDYEQPSQAPTVIEGGKAVSVTMRSTNRISSSIDGVQVLQAFRGDNANVKLVLLPLTSLSGSRGVGKTVVTQSIAFNDLGRSTRQ